MDASAVTHSNAAALALAAWTAVPVKPVKTSEPGCNEPGLRSDHCLIVTVDVKTTLP